MPRSETISVQPCTMHDMPRNVAIHFSAFNNQHIVIDSVFPYHWTTAGRQAALKRHTAPDFLTKDPSMVHLKIIDTSLEGVTPAELGTADCDPHIGYARWQIKRRGEETPASLDKPEDPGDWWTDARQKRFAEYAIGVLTGPRREKMRHTPIDQSLFALDCLAVMPGFQGRGAGEEGIRWGIEQADREGAECVLESAPTAEKVYTKFGFERVRHVFVDPPEDLADFGGDSFIWMVRKPRAPGT